MMEDFYNKIQVLEEFDIEVETIRIIKDNSKFITELLKQQLAAGKDGNDEPVTIFGSPFYKDKTVFEKQFHGKDALAKETGHITNYMTGEFYNEIYVVVNGQQFQMFSSVEYFNDIIIRSGSIIMELNGDHLQQFSQQILIPQLQAIFTARFNGV